MRCLTCLMSEGVIPCCPNVLIPDYAARLSKPRESFSILQGSQSICGPKETAEMEFIAKAQTAGNVLDLGVTVEEQLHGLLV